MTGVARGGCFILAVTIDAPLHLHGVLRPHGVSFHHFSVTTLAFDVGACVGGMAEENKIRQFINPLRRNLARGDIHVANLALADSRKAGAVPRRGLNVARDALQLQRGVPLMAKRAFHARVERFLKRYGKQKATNASEYVSLYLLPPPAAITTYCLPFFFDKKVIGVA